MENIENNDVEKIESTPLKKFKALKIVTAVLFSVATLFVVYLAIDIASSPQNIGTAFALVLWICLAIGILAVPMIVSLVGMIITIVNKKRSACTLGSVIYFIVFTGLPVVVFFICTIMFNLVFN